jgi:anti-sigma factor RsiW
VTCREFADFIFDYLEGDLDPDVRARFEHHLTLCPACVNYIAAYQATVALGRDGFADGEGAAEEAGAPESLVRSILAALHPAESPS